MEKIEVLPLAPRISRRQVWGYCAIAFGFSLAVASTTALALRPVPVAPSAASAVISCVDLESQRAWRDLFVPERLHMQRPKWLDAVYQASPEPEDDYLEGAL